MLVFSLVFAAAFAAAVPVALAVTVEIAPSSETCAWYLKWPDEKIRAYATDCLTRLPADYPRARRIPFIAVTRNNWCRNKTAAEVEQELNDILDAGADELVAFEMTAIVDDPALYAVFLKYCGRN